MQAHAFQQIQSGGRHRAEFVFPECGRVRVMPGLTVTLGLRLRAVIFCVQNGRLLPERAFELQRDHFRTKITKCVGGQSRDHRVYRMGANWTLNRERAELDLYGLSDVGAWRHGLGIRKVDDRIM